MVQPTYPLTAGLSLTSLRSVVTQALERLERLPLPPEWVDGDLMLERGWPALREALVAAHNPQEEVRYSYSAVIVRCSAALSGVVRLVQCGVIRHNRQCGVVRHLQCGRVRHSAA